MSQPIIDIAILHEELLAVDRKLTNLRIELQDIASDLDREIVRFRGFINKVYLARLEAEGHEEECPSGTTAST